jgi:hypothetical protein
MSEPRERYDHNANNVTGTPVDEENDLVPIQLWRELEAEIERLRAYTAAYDKLLAERVEIECLRGLAIRAWNSFRSGLTAGGGCDCGLTDADILELVRLANEHPPA